MILPSSATRHVLNVHGIELSYTLQGRGEPLLLLHGFTGAGRDFTEHLPELGVGRRLIVPDLRGHGHSTNPSGRFTFRECAADVLALLDHLGIERCDALGLSGGALTLLRMAVERPRVLASMLLVSASDDFPPEARAFMRAYTPASRSPEEWAQMRVRHVHGDTQIEQLFRQAAALADSEGDVSLSTSALASIEARTLLVSGDRDPLYPPEIALRLYRSIPRAALWIVPEGGHVPVFDHARAELCSRARWFFANGTEPA